MVKVSREIAKFFLLALIVGQYSVHGTGDTNMTKPFRILSPIAIKSRLFGMQDSYPNLIRVDSAQAKYGLLSAGSPEDCPFEEGRGCLNYFATIQDFVVHPEASESSNRLPAVLLSGALHGDERVGPTAVLELVSLLLESTACEVASQKSQCQQQLRAKGVSVRDRKWLARLVTTRRLVIVPTANALGYYRNVREEGSVDVNRDFPFDQKSPKLCMQSMAARTLNELYRDNMFQMSITFHAGMEVIAYQWGAMSYWDRPVSPDDQGQYEVAAAMSWFGGSFCSTKPYSYGPSNYLVYPVRGGMEDWAYGGSWDKSRMIRCDPETFGGYPRNKTQYSPGTLRSFVMLVETSDDKWPASDTLGRPEQLLHPRGTGSGHVSRNLRVALAAVDLVEPYVVVDRVNRTKVPVDLVPLLPRHNCRDVPRRAVEVRLTPSPVVEVAWTVGGAISVDATKVLYARWSDIPVGKWKCGQQPSEPQPLEPQWRQGKVTSSATGGGRFSTTGETPFTAELDLSGYTAGDAIVVLAAATVDAGWADVPPEAVPDRYRTPQAHVVRARTDPSWFHQADDNGKVVQGREYWYSPPVTLALV